MSYGQLVRNEDASMAALELRADRSAHVVRRPVPQPAAGELQVRITSAGVCGSDVTALAGGHPFRVPPLITGHEGGGRVTGVGADVPPDWMGRAVALEPQRACGECRACTVGLAHLCRNRVMLGMPQWSGTLAEYVVAPLSSVHPVSDAVPDDLLALVEPLAVARHALRRVDELDDGVFGASVAVLGGGAIGALIAFLARRFGARSVAVSEPRPGNRELCERFGATVTAPDADGLRTGEGHDVVLIAAAVDRLVDDAVSLLAPRGIAVQVGLFAAPLTVDVAALQQDERTLTGSNVYTHEDFTDAVAALEADTDVLRTMTGPLVDLHSAGRYLEQKLAGTPDDVVKLLVDPVVSTP